VSKNSGGNASPIEHQVTKAMQTIRQALGPQ
jgi:hypothetical protein